jgi:hypothetical protein
MGTAETTEALHHAYTALGEGNVEPLVSLMAPDMEWRARKRGWRFWQPVPS